MDKNFNPKCVVACLRCGSKRLIRRSALDRRTSVRCLECGGPVEASKTARKNLVLGTDRRRAMKDKQSFKKEHWWDN